MNGRVLADFLELMMKKYILTAAIAAATTFSAPVSAQTSLDAILTQIALQCESTATLTSCDQLVQQQINALVASGSLTPAQRASAIARVVETATSALSRSGGANSTVATEITQIVGSATTSLNAIASSSPEAASAVNSAVSRTTVAVLTVVQDRGVSGTGDISAIAGALTTLAGASTDTAQQDAVQDIADTLNAGGSIVDVIEEIEVVNSYASPA